MRRQTVHHMMPVKRVEAFYKDLNEFLAPYADDCQNCHLTQSRWFAYSDIQCYILAYRPGLCGPKDKAGLTADRWKKLLAGVRKIVRWYFSTTDNMTFITQPYCEDEKFSVRLCVRVGYADRKEYFDLKGS